MQNKFKIKFGAFGCAFVAFGLLMGVFGFVGTASAQERFVYEDFEDQNFLDTFVSTAESYCNTMTTLNTIISTAPYAGTYCMRYNGVSDTNSRINIGEYSPYGGPECGIFTEFTDNYTNDFVVRFRIKYASDFNWGSNCRKILRIKGPTYGTNAYFTWSQYGTYANIFLGNEAYSYGEIDLRYEPYNPPENEWIEIYVHLRFSEDTVLVKATDSGGEHIIYDGIYFDTGGAGYDGQDANYITLVGARCGTSEGGQGNFYIDDVEIWDGDPTSGPDTTPPSCSNPQPTGILSSGTTQTTISLTTNETATCKYSTNPNTVYASMPNTFSSTNSTNHSQIITGLSDGNTYTYYIRCQDTATPPNQNTDDFTISFSIASASTTYGILDFAQLVIEWLWTALFSVDINNDGIVNTRDLGIMMSNWSE